MPPREIHAGLMEELAEMAWDRVEATERPHRRRNREDRSHSQDARLSRRSLSGC